MKALLYEKAKKEFEKAFNQYARVMYKHYRILHEQPELYYSEKLAQQNKQQVETRFYLKENVRLKKRFLQKK